MPLCPCTAAIADVPLTAKSGRKLERTGGALACPLENPLTRRTKPSGLYGIFNPLEATQAALGVLALLGQRGACVIHPGVLGLEQRVHAFPSSQDALDHLSQSQGAPRQIEQVGLLEWHEGG